MFLAVRLVLLKQWRLLASLRSFWLTSTVAVLEHVGQVRPLNISMDLHTCPTLSTA
jgi:hypothetical protein